MAERGAWRRLRRACAFPLRGRLAAWLLGAPPASPAPGAPGLLLIQIDGLARSQLERAMDKGRLPYLQNLLRRQGYALCSHYSGLPSTTPAVQAELFYGVPCAVPAFDFFDRDGGLERVMYEHGAAERVQRALALEHRGLLAGGSAYVNIYDGGAAEPHACAARMSAGEVLQRQTAWTWARLLALHSPSVVRIVALGVLELFLALYDFAKGVGGGRKLWPELKFVPIRTLVSAGLREWATANAEADLARGLPVIHVNYIGYDEQSHRRGPSSAFAHWTLKGIDGAIRRLATAAGRSHMREYRVWVYSDHGQAACRPFTSPAGDSLRTAVQTVAARHGIETGETRRLERSEELQRARWFSRTTAPLHSLLQRELAENAQVRVHALGPLGHIYFAERPDGRALEAFCDSLVTECAAPLAVARTETGELRAWTADGVFSLPRDMARVAGAEHPFLDRVAEDLARLARHPDAGDILVFGWRHGWRPQSFVGQSGCHGGMHPEEVEGFALLPEAVAGARDVLRPSELRAAALVALGEAGERAAKEGAA